MAWYIRKEEIQTGILNKYEEIDTGRFTHGVNLPAFLPEKKCCDTGGKIAESFFTY